MFENLYALNDSGRRFVLPDVSNRRFTLAEDSSVDEHYEAWMTASPSIESLPTGLIEDEV